MRGYAAIGIINSKTEINVGGAMRAATCYGAATVVVEGARYRRQASDVTSMWRHIPLFHVDDLWTMIPFDATPVAVEFIQTGISLVDFKHPERAFYIFGPEDDSIPERILTRCKNLVYVPTVRCMNLAATVNVVLYDRMAKREKRNKSSSNESHTLEIMEMEPNKIANAS